MEHGVFFADPRAIYYEGEHKRTYVGYLTRGGDIMVGYYDHRDNTVSSSLIKKEFQIDDHANPTLYLEENGNITVFYSAHNGAKMYYRTSELPENISTFGPEKKQS